MVEAQNCVENGFCLSKLRFVGFVGSGFGTVFELESRSNQGRIDYAVRVVLQETPTSRREEYMKSVQCALIAMSLCLFVPMGIGQEPESVQPAGSGSVGLWELRSRHLVWGMPRQVDARHNIVYPGETLARSGLSVLVREGFVVGHYDAFKVPAWVSVRWSREDFDRLASDSYGRPFARDEELPRYAQADIRYDFSTSQMERGHMARHEDNEAWGKDNSDAGCLMSNVVPQHKDMNGEAWNDLEELHQEAVDDTSLGIDALWVISGPIFEHGAPQSSVGNGVGVPEATYKVIGWFDEAGDFQARGYVVRQEDRERDNPARYLRSIDSIEQATGLDFFPELPAQRAQEIESALPSDLWGLPKPRSSECLPISRSRRFFPIRSATRMRLTNS